MIVTRPTKDLNRLFFLETARKHIKTCLEKEPNVPFACLSERLATLPEEYDAAMKDVRETTGNWRKATKNRIDAVNPLSRCCRDFYVALQRRTEREGHGPHVLEYFKMQSDANLPKPNQVGAWVLIARDLIEGEELAIADGYPPMANPSCEDLQKNLCIIDEASETVTKTHSEQQDAQQALNNLREEAEVLFRRLYHFLVGWLLLETPSRRRNAMRKFGYVFGPESGDNPKTEPEPGIEDAPAQTPLATAETKAGEAETPEEPQAQGLPPQSPPSTMPLAS